MPWKGVLGVHFCWSLKGHGTQEKHRHRIHKMFACFFLSCYVMYVCIYIYIYACSLCLFNNSCQSSLFSFVRVWAQLVNQEYNRSVTVTRQAYMNICMSLSRYIYIYTSTATDRIWTNSQKLISHVFYVLPATLPVHAADRICVRKLIRK